MKRHCKSVIEKRAWFGLTTQGFLITTLILCLFKLTVYLECAYPFLDL